MSRDYPAMTDRTGAVEPVPRRVRGLLGGQVVLDTTRARYVWLSPKYPRFDVPAVDVSPEALALSVPGQEAGHVHVPWDALDAWLEEDEEVFVHPRNPYTRVDALRSSRHVQVELDGVLLAESFRPVLVFETGLPTRYYLDRTDVRLDRLVPSATRSACPYKGRTTGYWSADTAEDIAWSYDFPTRPLLPVAGLIAFLNERVDLVVDGHRLERPVTHLG